MIYTLLRKVTIYESATVDEAENFQDALEQGLHCHLDWVPTDLDSVSDPEIISIIDDETGEERDVEDSKFVENK